MSKLIVKNNDKQIELLNSDVKIGGRNYVLDSAKPVTVTGNNKNNQTVNIFNFTKSLNQFTPEELSHLILSWHWGVSNNSSGTLAYVQFNDFPWGANRQNDFTMNFSKTSSGKICQKIDLSKYLVADLKANGLSVRLDGFTGALTIDHIKLEVGDIPTDWTPAPEDIESEIQALKSKLGGVKLRYRLYYAIPVKEVA